MATRKTIAFTDSNISGNTTGTASGLSTVLVPASGGTGVANGTNNTITFTGNYTLGLTLSANTAVTLPTSGTLATVAGTLPIGGGTMTGKITDAGIDEVGKTYTPASGAQTVALDCSVNNMHIVTGNASGTAITFTITGATNNQPFIVSILQGGTTVSTIAAWFNTCRWAGGTVPTLTATLNKRDTFGFIRTGVNTYDAFIIGQNC